MLPHPSSHLSCEATAMCSTGKGKGDSVSPHLLLQSPGSFCLLKPFPVPKILSQVMMANNVSLTHRERKYTLLYTASVCAGHHPFLRARSSTAMNQALSYSAGCTPKFHVVPIATTPRILCATGSILDLAQREQFQAVYSMDEKNITLYIVVQAGSL